MVGTFRLEDGIGGAYPTLWRDNFDREGRTDDQQDAYSVAAWMCRTDCGDRLLAFPNPSSTTNELEVARIEGWLLGVKRYCCI